MLKIGLTGSLYSGIDDVAQTMREMNIPVFDADLALKFIFSYREDVIKNIKIQLGSEVFASGVLNPDKFNTNEKFNRLIDIAQFELLKCYELWRLKNRRYKYTVFKSSILYEKGLDSHMNDTICIFRPKDARVVEMRNRTGLSIIDIDRTLSNEMEDLTKNQKSTYIIHNYEEASKSVRGQIKVIHNKISEKVINSPKFDATELRGLLM